MSTTAKENLEAIKLRIKKLKAHAESAKALGSLAEAEAFANKANELLLEYNLSLADCMSAETEEKEFAKWVYGESVSYKDNQSGSAWRIELVQVLCRHNFCNFTFNRGLKTFRVYGHMENVDTVVWLYHFLSTGLLRIGQQAHVNLPSYEKLTYNRYSFLKDFLLGAVRGIDDQLDELKRVHEKASAIGALILYNNRQLDKFVKTRVPNLKSGSPTRGIKTVGSAYKDGYKAGKEFKITKPLGSSTTTKTKAIGH